MSVRMDICVWMPPLPTSYKTTDKMGYSIGGLGFGCCVPPQPTAIGSEPGVLAHAWKMCVNP
jgi:hypothetical protein